MNRAILNLIIKKMNSSSNRFLVSSLSYYAILAIIPTFLLLAIILENFNISILENYKNILDKLTINWAANSIIFLVIIYMISKTFFNAYNNKFSIIKSLLLSVISSIGLIIFLTLFLSTYTIPNNILSIALKVLLIFLFSLLLFYFTSQANFKYSCLFSFFLSIFSNIFLYFFLLSASFFINYENYYGILAPIFIIILAIHLFIYITFIAYISAEEFTKISKIKFVKR